ncbi:DUF190 domain-containing protein [Carboxylicivirga taeanensis]|uniref:DUF190 domain-containing protein n=1 Tax=Carboxylicivirga taeanensis TaxID=1416875 RepID=UPI003F6DD89F
MVLEGDVQKLKMIIEEDDKVYQRPLYEAIVFAAKKYKMAGITVTKGIMSYGPNSLINNSKVFTISDNIPIIIELIDRTERINSFSEIATKLIEKANCGAIIYTENVEVILYRSSSK